MTTTLVNGTLTITYTATQAKLSRVLLSAAEYLYPHYPLYEAENMIPFANLTNAQKLGIIDKHIKRVLMDAAQTQITTVAIEAARVTALGEDITI